MRTRHLIPLLAACSAIGMVGNYLFLPALPQIGVYYGVQPGTAQLTVTSYLVSFAIGVLLSGPLADRFGRRPVLVAGVAVTGVGALLCYIAPTMGWFVAARVLQGAAGGFGITVSRASVGDLFEERELARMYAILTMALVMGTSLAPYAGGLITRYVGWREAFLWLAGLAGIMAVACRAWLPETRPANARSQGFVQLWRESRTLLGRPVFLAYMVQAALIYALFFVFVSFAPYVMMSLLGFTADQFGIYYLFLAVGFFIGNLTVSRSGPNHDVTRQTHAGLNWQLVGVTAALAFVLLGFTHPLAVFGPMALFSFGQGLALPNLIAHGIRLAPNNTGVASSLFGFSQLALSGICVQALGLFPVRGWQSSVWFCFVGAALISLWVRRVESAEVSATRT